MQTPGTLVFQGDFLLDRSMSEVLPCIVSGTLSAGSLAAHISFVSQTDFDCFGSATRKVILEGRGNWYVSSDSLGDWMRTRCGNGWPALECLQLDGCDKTWKAEADSLVDLDMIRQVVCPTWRLLKPLSHLL
jgi:hypothetical protein